MRLKTIISLVVAGTFVSFLSPAQQTVKITPSNTAYLEYLPQGYNTNSNLYPIVISLHGIKEKGTTSTDPAMITASAAKVANVGLAKYVKYGKQYPFILISPQLKSSYGNWPAAYVMDVINYVKKTLRVDPKRIYITGLSLGGFGAWTTLGAYPDVFAAALPICAGGNALSKACGIAASNVPVWGFHGDKDGVVSYTVTTRMVNAINACTPKPNPLAKATLFAGLGHIIWDKVYNQTNALDWMLGFRNGTTTATAPVTANTAPQVTAGNNVVVYLPTNVAYCNGSATDSDGTIISHAWSQVSGPSTATLYNTNTKSLKATNLKAGTYRFKLKATDNDGASASDYADVVVNNATSTTTSSGNVAPVANAGANKTITLPTNSVTLYGSGTDNDGKIVSYKWTQYGGPSAASITNSTYASATFSNLKEGSYYFRLTVKDEDGASDIDNVLVKVSDGSVSMVPDETSLETMLAYAN